MGHTNLARLLLVALLSAGVAQAFAEGREVDACVLHTPSIPLDKVWGGTKVGFDAIESARAIYIGYYDSERWLSVSAIDKCTQKITKVRIPSQYAGWDAHNYVTLALDNTGRLHVAGNMHASKLVYARMERPDDINSLKPVPRLVGTEEERVTYPNFFSFQDGSLGFSYRSGESGSGTEIIDRFGGDGWQRWLDKPLMASSSSMRVSAYPTKYTLGPDKNFHVAWVWRTGDVETNFRINYAKSADLRRWTNSKGEEIRLPMTPDNAEVVDPIPQRAGLFNNIQLGFDEGGRPIISYLKFDSAGATQLWHARLEGNTWHIYKSTQWTYRWDPRGAGTIPMEIGFSGVQWRDGMLLESVRHPAMGSVIVQYDPATLQVDKMLKGYAWTKLPKVDRTAPRGLSLSVQRVRGLDSNAPSYAISWVSMPADTRDLQRPCKPEIADCRYAYDLLLHGAD